MTAAALDLAPTAASAARPTRERVGHGSARRNVGTRPASPVRRPVTSSPAGTAPVARPRRGSRGPAIAPATKLRPGVRATARSCRGEAAPVGTRQFARAAAAVQVGWRFTDRGLALIIGLVAAVVLAAVVAVAHTAIAVTSEPDAATAAPGVTANAAVAGPAWAD